MQVEGLGCRREEKAESTGACTTELNTHGFSSLREASRLSLRSIRAACLETELLRR